MKSDARITGLQAQLLVALSRVQGEVEAEENEGKNPQTLMFLAGVCVGLGVAGQVLQGAPGEAAFNAVADQMEDALSQITKRETT